MDIIIPPGIAQLSVIPFAILVAWLIFAGHLVPGRTVKREEAMYERTIAALERQNESLQRQNAALMEGNQTTIHTVQAVREAAERGSGDEATHVRA